MIQGETIELRAITKEDTDLIIKWRNSDFVRLNFLDQRLFSKESHEYWLEHYVFTGKVAQFIMIEKESRMPIGSIYLRDIDKGNKKAEYGIFIGEKSAHNKGYATEAGKLLLEYATTSLDLHRIYLRVLADNLSAIKSYEKVGFVQEGCLRDDVLLQNEYRDIVWMSYLRKY